MQNSIKNQKPIGVILAGGAAQRMGGGDKTLLSVGGIPILRRIIQVLLPQTCAIVISANGDPARFLDFGLPVFDDSGTEQQGPMAGIIGGLKWAAHHYPEIETVLSVSGDTPFLPDNLVEYLENTRHQAPLGAVVAASGGRIHPTIALWPTQKSAVLCGESITNGRNSPIKRGNSVQFWLEKLTYAAANWQTEPFDPFLNVNTPEDLAKANAIAMRNHG